MLPVVMLLAPQEPMERAFSMAAAALLKAKLVKPIINLLIRQAGEGLAISMA